MLCYVFTFPVYTANINDRSLLGKKDSEVSVIIEDTDMVGLMLYNSTLCLIVELNINVRYINCHCVYNELIWLPSLFCVDYMPY